jgi:hypothetical protein
VRKEVISMYRDESIERCNRAADLKATWEEARKDNHFSDEELDEIEAFIIEGYIEAEVLRARDAVIGQLVRIPSSAPTRTAKELLREIEDYTHRWAAERNRILLTGKDAA